MKNHTSVGKSALKTNSDSSRPSSGGENGVAIVPPDYGIGFVDRRMEAAVPVQLVGTTGTASAPASAPTPNRTGLPDQLKSGIETLSGYSMDDVKVHYNSSKPAQLNAHAYAQGNQIHLGAGQERHLPHEAWHVVQQKQGRVRPTLQMKGGVGVNDDAGLEREADVMGAKATRGERLSGPAWHVMQHKQGRVKPSLQCEGVAMNSSHRPVMRQVKHSGAEVLQREAVTGLARRSIPKELEKKAEISDKSKTAWDASGNAERAKDTFVGITCVDPTNASKYGHFMMYPCFNEVDDGKNRSKLYVPDRPLATNLGGLSTQDEVQKQYGAENYIFKPAQLPGGIDGYFHKEVCARESTPEDEVIGWSVRGNKAKGSGTIRFVSGRNLDKFVKKEKHNVKGREARDMPKAWAKWITQILKEKLGLKLSGYSMGQHKTSTGKTARKREFTVKN